MASMAVGQRGGGRVGVGEAAGGAVERDQLEGDFLRDGHHDLLQLGFGAEADQPDFAAGVFGGEMRRLRRARGGPGIEHGGQHHFVFQRRAGGAGDGFEGLQRIGDDACADDDVVRVLS